MDVVYALKRQVSLCFVRSDECWMWMIRANTVLVWPYLATLGQDSLRIRWIINFHKTNRSF
jgi:hypothetical protein